MPFVDLLAGVGLLILSTGSALAFSAVAVQRRLPELAGAPKLLAFGLLATLGFLAIHLVPGALGVLGKASVATCAVLLLAATAWLPRVTASGPNEMYPGGAPSGRAAWALALAGAGLVAIYA